MTRPWREDLSGMKFGRLSVISFAGVKNGHRQWNCVCECGNEKSVSHSKLKRSLVISCGCFRSEITKERMTKHGSAGRENKTRAYKIWSGMVARCEIRSATGFDRYGAVGVKVCERWHCFENFLSDMGDPPAGGSIDRIDGSKGYEPGNCRWASRQTQNENRKSVRWIEFNGLRMNVSQWARHLGVSKATLYEALGKHPIEVALRERTK